MCIFCAICCSLFNATNHVLHAADTCTSKQMPELLLLFIQDKVCDLIANDIEAVPKWSIIISSAVINNIFVVYFTQSTEQHVIIHLIPLSNLISNWYRGPYYKHTFIVLFKISTPQWFAYANGWYMWMSVCICECVWLCSMNHRNSNRIHFLTYIFAVSVHFCQYHPNVFLQWWCQ